MRSSMALSAIQSNSIIKERFLRYLVFLISNDKDIFTAYKRLLNPSPKMRLSVSQFLELGSRAGSFFSTDLIRCSQSLENMSIQGDQQRETFLQSDPSKWNLITRQLESSLDKYPAGFLQHKVLPEMLKSFEFGGGGPKVFTIIVTIGEKLSDDDFERDIQPVVVRMFASPERAIRLCLLENLTKVIERINSKVVNDKLFPNLVIFVSNFLMDRSLGSQIPYPSFANKLSAPSS
jgi:SCY1-like protein 1